MRGKVAAYAKEKGVQRITPAYAGKSYHARYVVIIIRDHPRVCGEKQILTYARMGSAGSPPRMRGKETASRNLSRSMGITPAYAGKRPCISNSRL